MTVHLPNSELVMLAWLKSIPGVDASKVATTLPGDTSVWATSGFITCMAVGGSPQMYVPMRQPAVSLAFWAVLPNSEKTPWGKAQSLAEVVFNAFYDPARFPFTATFGSLSYSTAQIRSGWPLTEPRKVPGSSAGFAQVTFDAALAWATA